MWLDKTIVLNDTQTPVIWTCGGIGLKVLFEDYIKKDSWEVTAKEYDSDMEDEDDGLTASLEAENESGMVDLRLDGPNDPVSETTQTADDDENDDDDDDDEGE